MLSKKTKYGLQALLHLARKYDQGPILISDLAIKEKISKKFLESILLELKNKGVLQSKKGKGGGYALNQEPEKITLGEVFRILEGPIAPVSCVSQTAYRKCNDCKEEATCGIRLIFKDVRDAIANVLDNTSLHDVIKRIDDAEKKKAFNYVI